MSDSDDDRDRKEIGCVTWSLIIFLFPFGLFFCAFPVDPVDAEPCWCCCRCCRRCCRSERRRSKRKFYTLQESQEDVRT